MISVRPTKFRFTFWTAAALLAVIVAPIDQHVRDSSACLLRRVKLVVVCRA